MAYDPHSSPFYTEGTMGPQVGGYAPNRSEAITAALQAQRNSAMTHYLMQNDNRAKFMASAIGGWAAGSHGQSWANSNTGRFVTAMAGGLINSPALSSFTGGNYMDMYQ